MSHSYDSTSNLSVLRAPTIYKRPNTLLDTVSPCNRMISPCSRNSLHYTLAPSTLIHPCTCMSSLLLPLHHSRHPIAHKRCIAFSANMNLTPQTGHEVIARRFVSITDGTSDRMLVIGTHTLPDVVFAIACFLRGS